MNYYQRGKLGNLFQILQVPFRLLQNPFCGMGNISDNFSLNATLTNAC